MLQKELNWLQNKKGLAEIVKPNLAQLLWGYTSKIKFIQVLKSFSTTRGSIIFKTAIRGSKFQALDGLDSTNYQILFKQNSLKLKYT